MTVSPTSDAQFVAAIQPLISQLIAGTITASAFQTAYVTALGQWPGPGLAALAQVQSDLVANLGPLQTRQFQAWLNGTATGGTNADGKYPLTINGVDALVACPAKMQVISGTVDALSAASAAAVAAAASASTIASGLTDASTLGGSRAFGVLMPGDVPAGVTEVLVDVSCRLIQATTATGAVFVKVPDPSNRDQTQAVLLPGDVASGVVSVEADSAGRLVQGRTTSGGVLVPQKDQANQDLTQAVLLPGDVASGVVSVEADGVGRLVQGRLATGSTLVTAKDATDQDLTQGVLLPGDVQGGSGGAGIFGGDGAMLLGVALPSGLATVRRQEPPSGVAYLTGSTPNRYVRAFLRGGQDFAISQPGDDPDVFVQNGDVITYRRTVGGTAELVDEMIALEVLPSGVTQLRMTISYGQSNSVGYGQSGAIVTAAPFNPRALMFARGTRITQLATATPVPFADLARLRPAFEQNEVWANNPPSETPCSGVAYQLLQSGGYAGTAASLVAAPGVGGATLTTLNKGTRPYLNLLRAVQRAKVMASTLGVAFVVDAVVWIQGEADVGTAYATYYAGLNQLQTDLDTDIRAITGQSAIVLLAGAQTCSWTYSGVTRADNSTAILNLALAYPSRFICTGPMYPYPAGTSLHLSAQGHRNHGETIGRAISRRLFNSVSNPCLYASSASRSAAVITVNMANVDGSLAIDTSVVTDPGSYGVGFTQTGGNSPTISSVAVSGSQVTVTLSATPTGTAQAVEFARTGVSGNNGGPTTGPRCCIRDTVAAQRADGSYLHKYAAVQTIPIT